MRTLVSSHYQQLYRYAYRLTGSVGEAEDLTQQTYLIAQEKLDQLRDRKAAGSWLLQILRRLFLKSLRQRDRLLAVSPTHLESVATPLPSSEVDSERIQQALDQLPDRFRLALLMYYFEDMSYEAIAAELKIPVGTVMSRLSRAKAHLRNRLKIAEVVP